MNLFIKFGRTVYMEDFNYKKKIEMMETLRSY